jgi:glycosyltransferase involved in cell wall biosynthesis
MIRVLHLRDTDRVCGPGKTIIETACATDRERFEQMVGLYMGATESRNPFFDAAFNRGVAIVPLRVAGRFDPRLVRAIVAAVRRHRVDVLHSHEYKSDILGYLASRISGIPIVSTVHGWITNTRRSRLLVGASRRLLRRFDRVIAVSAGTRRAILAHNVPTNRIVVIPNGIVTRNYRREDREKGVFRRRYGIPDGAVVVGCVGRLSKEKGQRVLLEAAATLVPTIPDAWIALVGEGPDRGDLEKAASALGMTDRVVLTGHLDDVRAVYRDLDVLALTSYTEGLPNVLLEALCMDVPVLATNVGGTAEIVKDGITGVLVPAGSPSAVSGGLRRLIENGEWARALAANGHRLVEEQFEFAKRVAREEALYEEIVKRRNARQPRRVGQDVA